MKLRNKKTGEIIEHYIYTMGGKELNSLAELNEEWEDYEEPKEYWCIDWIGGVNHIIPLDDSGDKYVNNKMQIGNYFETKEQAEKALEKLKAWKRLKDKGIKTIDWGWHTIDNPFREDDGKILIKVLLDTETYDCSWDDDLDLLFGRDND